MNFLNKAKFLIAPIIFAFCICGIVFIQLPKINKQEKVLGKEEYHKQAIAEKFRLNLVNNLPAFSLDNLIADWNFIQFILYFGDGEARAHTDYSLAPEYFEAVVERDPKFLEAYFAFSPATSIFAGNPERTVALFEQGIAAISPESNPYSYLLWMYKAIDELLFLGDSEAARHSYEMAAKWADIIDDETSRNVAARARKTAQFLADDPNSIGAQISSWGTVLSVARDEKTRNLAISKIHELGGEILYADNGTVKVKAPKSALKKSPHKNDL